MKASLKPPMKAPMKAVVISEHGSFDKLRIEIGYLASITNIYGRGSNGDIGCRQRISTKNQALCYQPVADRLWADCFSRIPHQTATAKSDRQDVRHAKICAHAANFN